MFKHTVSYVDFNGNDRKEDLYFHLSLPEITRLEAEIGKSLEEYITELVDQQKTTDLLGFLERVLLNSYGVKTTDGRSFHKSKDIRDSFEYSQAYAEVFEDVLLNPELAKKFGEKVADNGKRRDVKPELVKTKEPETDISE